MEGLAGRVCMKLEAPSLFGASGRFKGHAPQLTRVAEQARGGTAPAAGQHRHRPAVGRPVASDVHWHEQRDTPLGSTIARPKLGNLARPKLGSLRLGRSER